MSSAFTRLSWGSELEPGVYCDDAVKKVFVPHSPKAVRLDDLLEVLLIRKLSDALHKVLVGVGVTGVGLANIRDDVHRVQVVHLPQHLVVDLAELKAAEVPTSLENPPRLAQAGVNVRDVPYPKGYGVGVEGLVVEGQALGVALDPGQPPLRVPDVQPGDLLLPLLQHGAVDVADAHLARRLDLRVSPNGEGLLRPPDLPKHAEPDVPRPASNVQVLLARKGVQGPHKTVFPVPVKEKTHKVVHRVVFRGNLLEDVLHQALVLGTIDRGEPEAHAISDLLVVSFGPRPRFFRAHRRRLLRLRR
mmetsp:Transcript_9649/g.34458  ORF Transcript_9649/g.34458 Transcript_9649/m.34458 type:complete len:303 (+) Transcript_9649:669-1577(+)